MSNSASSYTGCFGCLGTILFFVFIGSIVFGAASIAVKFGDLVFGFGSAVNILQPPENKNLSVNDLEIKYQAAEVAVKQFHSQLEQGKCQEIYAQANELLRKNSKQADFLAFCNQVSDKLGTIQSTQQLDWWWQLNNNDSEKLILSRYETKFSKSSIQETFIWLVKDKKPELIGYQVSPSAVSIQSLPKTNSVDNGKI
ncbi:MAG: hypothetical protein KME21_29230 [Desmonostoc vinosum HA7617-LM4]|jgi:hypothetical protein|nr:hypothetical protein [Desmonostoc vinosum HA7617-LM4]